MGFCPSGLLSQCAFVRSPSKSLTPIRSEQNVGPDLGPNYLKGLSADDNVM